MVDQNYSLKNVNLVEKVDVHQDPPRSILRPRKQWYPLRQVLSGDGENFGEYESW